MGQPSGPQGQLSHVAEVKGGASYTQPSDVNVSRAATQTMDVCLAFGGNKPLLPQGRGPRRDSTGQHSTMAPGGITSYSH